MRFRIRLSAAILAVVMMVSSIQIPGGISYAAEMADSGIESGQNVSVLTAEDTEDTEGGAEISADGDEQNGDNNPADGGKQAKDHNFADGDSQAGDDKPAGDDSQTDNENVSEKETDAGQIPGDDAEEPVQSLDTEESEPEEPEVVKTEIEGAYQFGDMPSASGGMSAFSISTYDESVEDYVYQQMLKRVDSIDLYAEGFCDVDTSDVANLVSGVINKHPDLYFVKKTYSYATSCGKVTDLYMDYYITSNDDAAFNKKVEAALACVTDEMSDDMKAIVLHDYLAINVEYDYDNYLSGNISTDSFTAYGALVNGIAVCNGYALAYQHLLNELGIENYMVTSRSMNHAWNLVKLDGEFYHVDVTWDDPTWDMVGRVRHAYLLRSDENLEEHYSWTVTYGINTYDYKATNTKYENAFWVECTSPLVFDGTNCYYISKDEMSLKKASFSNITNTGTKIAGIDKWKYYKNGSLYGYWQGVFSGLYMINGRLFYNDENSIYSINPDGTGKKTEFTPDKTNNDQIYYSAYRNDIVVYALHTDPNLTGKQTVLTAKIEGVEEPEIPPQPDGTYIITYVLDGGTNDNDNPATYTAETSTIVLKDATKAGYKFEGWYKDSTYMQNITEIPEGSTGDITLYAKWSKVEEGKDGLNAENLNYSFTTLDDETVSSRADGKPKVLIFLKPDCYYCKNTIRDLSQHIKNFNGVDIYAIESFILSTKAEIADFKNTYGCDEITFCYDKNGMTRYHVWDYVDLTHIGGNSVTTPAIIFIDSENRVQHGTAGARSWTQILEDLQKYCGYVYVETYKIIYVLDGGENDSANPVTYTSETETITLMDAVKDGYTFEGWYKDAGFKEKVTEIVNGSTGDITLYAKWKADQIVTDPDDQGSIQTGIYVRFTDYYRLGENSSPCYKYTGAAVTPDVEVYNNGTLLTNGTDYTITYKNNTKVGMATLSVKGKGSFSGASNAVSFEIINADIRTDTEHPLKMTVIAGTKVTPTIMNGTKKLTAKDYRLEGENLVDGKYAQPTGVTPNTLTVTGIGSYEGSSFTIAVTVIDSKDAKKLAVTVDKNFKPVYDGNAIDLASLFSSPTRNGSITVTDSKEKTKVLENGKDFSVVCSSSLRDAGTVKFTVTGMGVYTGSVSKSFKISPLRITDNIRFNVTYDNRVYEYKTTGTTVDNLKVTYLGETASADDDKVLTPGLDYKVAYANNKKVSTEGKKAQVKITFLGSYKGSKPVTKDFTIGAAKLSMQTSGAQAGNTKVIVPDKVYDKAGKAYKSTPIVTVDGVSIKASNYSVSYAWTAVTYAGTEGRYEEGSNISLEETDRYAKVKVTITLNGSNYALASGTGSIEGEYYVRRKTEGVTDLSKAKVTFRDKDGKQLNALEYNGRVYYTPEGNDLWGGSVQTDPNAIYVSVSVNGKSVDSSLYNVVWTDATAKGKATVVVTGKGSGAVGSKNQTISIKPMALKDKIINYFKLN